jgi:hypothetical protein
MFAEHLSGYFSDFGETVAVGTTTGTVIVDAAVDDFNRVLASAVVLTAIAADFPGVAAGDPVTLRATSYTVRSIEPDGTGLVLLKVSRP